MESICSADAFFVRAQAGESWLSPARTRTKNKQGKALRSIDPTISLQGPLRRGGWDVRPAGANPPRRTGMDVRPAGANPRGERAWMCDQREQIPRGNCCSSLTLSLRIAVLATNTVTGNHPWRVLRQGLAVTVQTIGQYRHRAHCLHGPAAGLSCDGVCRLLLHSFFLEVQFRAPCTSVMGKYKGRSQGPPFIS